MLRLFHGIAVAIMGLSMFIKVIAGLLIHLLTTWIAFDIKGLLAAILTFILPPFSEIFWAFSIFMATGVFFNIVTLLILGYLAIWIVIIFAGAMVAASEPT